MAESEAVQAIMNLVDIQAATAAELKSGSSTSSPREVHRQRHSRPAVKQLLFNWNVTDKTYELTEEDNAISKKWLGREGFHFIKTFTNTEKETCKVIRYLFSTMC